MKKLKIAWIGTQQEFKRFNSDILGSNIEYINIDCSEKCRGLMFDGYHIDWTFDKIDSYGIIEIVKRRIITRPL